jgi:hypothetical protein
MKLFSAKYINLWSRLASSPYLTRRVLVTVDFHQTSWKMFCVRRGTLFYVMLKLVSEPFLYIRASAVEGPPKRAELMYWLVRGLRLNVTRFRECGLGGLTEWNPASLWSRDCAGGGGLQKAIACWNWYKQWVAASRFLSFLHFLPIATSADETNCCFAWRPIIKTWNTKFVADLRYGWYWQRCFNCGVYLVLNNNMRRR